jgi:hypothetical protein
MLPGQVVHFGCNSRATAVSRRATDAIIMWACVHLCRYMRAYVTKQDLHAPGAGCHCFGNQYGCTVMHGLMWLQVCCHDSAC